MSQARPKPGAAPSPLIVFIDFKSPYAYLAKDLTYALEDEFAVAFDWRPFNLDIGSYLGSARLNHEGRVVESRRSPAQWLRVKYAYHDVRRYGAPRGMIIRGTTKIWDSSLAGVGMLWAKSKGRDQLRAYLDRVYDRFWKRELDLEDTAVIEGVLKDIGADTSGFQAWSYGEGRRLHDEMQRETFNSGIFGVPTYVIGRERYFGREHLPRIRWILSGREGHPPDVAYEDFTAAQKHTNAAVPGRLTAVIDVKNPYSYLALEGTLSVAKALGGSVDWLPLLVSPWRKRTASSDDDRSVRHRKFRADYAEDEVRRYARDLNLPLDDPYRETDSTLAALGLLWARRASETAADSYVQQVFEAYWRNHVNIEERGAIASMLNKAGAAPAGFDSFVEGEGPSALEHLRAELLDAGIFDVPAYRLDGEIYIGRQHLPLIRSLLRGARVEPVP